MEDLIIKKLIILGKFLNNSDIIKMSRRLMMEREKGLGQYSIKKLIEMDKVIGDISFEFNFYEKELLDWAEDNIDEEKLKELEEYVIRSPKTIYIVKALGTCDFDMELMADSPKDLFDFIEDIENKFPNIIRDYKTLIFDKTIKANFLPKEI